MLGNIEAMRWATETLAGATRVDVDAICEIHRRLLQGTRHEHIGGVIRTTQNWIGGSSYNPCSAAFVPPPEKHVRALMEDLCDFINDDELPTVVHAGLVHAQFETIHPFHDGNGRVGRALIHLVLRRRGVVSRVLPPVSLILATWAQGVCRRTDGDALPGSGVLTRRPGGPGPLGRALRHGHQAGGRRRRRLRGAGPAAAS